MAFFNEIDHSNLINEAVELVRQGGLSGGKPPERLELGDETWRSLNRSGLLGLGLPGEYGGRGGGFPEMSLAGRALVEAGLGLGLALTLGLHFLVGRFVLLRLGTEDQKREFLPLLASGRASGCLAISEPEGGAHPGRMKTTAIRTGGSYRLEGEKTYLTNAPLAAFFVVMAVTGESGGRKLITAFLVPRDAPGVRVEEISLEALKPSPHGRLVLGGVEVPESNALGPRGEAYAAIIKPFREAEDAMFMGPLAGAMSRLTRLAAAERRESIGGFGGDFGGEPEKKLGRLLYLAHAGGILAREAAERLDRAEPGPGLALSSLAGRDLGRGFLKELEEFRALTGVVPSSGAAMLVRDFEFLNRLAHNVLVLKQMKLGRDLAEKGPGPAAGII
ncbi:MAG: acyl-CoA dehydrogenase [Pseudomonadota bacterium]